MFLAPALRMPSDAIRLSGSLRCDLAAILALCRFAGPNLKGARILMGLQLGSLDLLVAIALRDHYGASTYMGPAYWIPAFWVPAHW
jgi:hypothetical protein